MPPKKKQNFTFTLLVLLIILSFVAGSMGGILASQYLSIQTNQVSSVISTKPTNQKVIQETYIEESSIIETVKEISPAVVSVIVTKDLPLYYQQYSPFNSNPFEDLFNDPFFGFPRYEIHTPDRNNLKEPQTEKQKIGGGSGFIFSKDGLIITNKHVVEDENAEYTVILNNGIEYAAEVLGRDPLNDLAVLKIKPEDNENIADLPYVELGDSDNLQIGQKVVAIGNALAEYENTVTAGVISAKGRNIVAGGTRQGSESLNGLLQTDAAINPGNSGGPLCNLNGEVIGINTAIATNADGISFAIPINDAKQVIESVNKYGKIVRPMLGIRYVMIDENNSDQLNLPEEFEYNYGALLTGDPNTKKYAVIPGSPADKAGLMKDDVILEVNREKINNANDLRGIATSHNIGDVLELKVWRDGKILEMKAKLDEVDTEAEIPEIQEQ